MSYSPTEFFTTCLFCGKTHELHADTDGERTPEQGDLSVCWDCGYVACYGPNMQLIPLTEEQQKYVETSSHFKQLMALMAIAKSEGAKRRKRK